MALPCSESDMSVLEYYVWYKEGRGGRRGGEKGEEKEI